MYRRADYCVYFTGCWEKSHSDGLLRGFVVKCSEVSVDSVSERKQTARRVFSDCGCDIKHLSKHENRSRVPACPWQFAVSPVKLGCSRCLAASCAPSFTFCRVDCRVRERFGEQRCGECQSTIRALNMSLEWGLRHETRQRNRARKCMMWSALRRQVRGGGLVISILETLLLYVMFVFVSSLWMDNTG